MSESFPRSHSRSRAIDATPSVRRGPDDADATGAPWPFTPIDPSGNAVAQADGCP
ncbi:MAG: hypothetical protein MUD17_10425 [Gemmatimonadaceae bacterium]|jgi:hypothetical protein|nr:hypothetical protein [Gemmatimonadaceae bacterium]